MKLTDILTERLIVPSLKSQGKLEVLTELAQILSRVDRSVNPETVARALLDRERINPTAQQGGVALPHAKTSAIDQAVACLAVSREGIDFDAEDGSLSQIFFAMLVPMNGSEVDHSLLSRMSQLLADPNLREALLAEHEAASILELIRTADARLGDGRGG